MIVLLVNKTTRMMTMGEHTKVSIGDINSCDGIFLEDIIDVAMHISPEGQAMPVANGYPIPPIESFLTDKGNKWNDSGHNFKTKDHIVYIEDYLQKQLLDWYKAVVVKRSSNIEIVSDMPSSGIMS